MRKGKREPDKNCFEKYYDYMQSVIPRLTEAEKTVNEIKGSKEWKRALNYFHVLYIRGFLKELPSMKNGYHIEKGTGLVSLSDIESILTPEQLEKVRQMSM